MKVQFEWQAGDDRGRWETISRTQRRRRMPWWGWMLASLAVALGLVAGYIWLA
jgi:type VI protein secretion system component VasF